MIKAEILKRMDYIIDNNLDDQNEYFNEYQQLGEQLIKGKTKMTKEEILKKMEHIAERNPLADRTHKLFKEYRKLGEQLIKHYIKEDLYFFIDNYKNEIYLTPEMVEYTGIKYLKEWENDYVPDTLFNCDYKYVEFEENKYFVYGAY